MLIIRLANDSAIGRGALGQFLYIWRWCIGSQLGLVIIPSLLVVSRIFSISLSSKLKPFVSKLEILLLVFLVMFPTKSTFGRWLDNLLCAFLFAARVDSRAACKRKLLLRASPTHSSCDFGLGGPTGKSWFRSASSGASPIIAIKASLENSSLPSPAIVDTFERS